MSETGLTPSGLEQVVIGGDLSKLSAADRLSYYSAVCQSLGLNPLTKPFEFITLNGKLTLYARRDCTDQLRKIHGVNIIGLVRERLEDVYVVTAAAELPGGRRDESIGAVSTAGLKGEALANALMKAETKAKRRVTLSIVGLGILDETEVETVPSAQSANVNQETGEISKPSQLPAARPPNTITAEPEPTNDNGKAGKVPSRTELEARYRQLVDQADVVGVPATMLDTSWPVAKLVQEGLALKAAITAREHELEKVG